MIHPKDELSTTLAPLARAFEAWEHGYRAEPAAFMTAEECADLQVSELSAMRAAYFWELLKATPDVDFYPNLMKGNTESRDAYYASRSTWGQLKPKLGEPS